MSVNNAFPHPPTLDPRHVEAFSKRGISPDFAIQAGCRTGCDNELRRLGFDTSLPIDQRQNGLQGIVFEYRALWNGSESVAWRLKPDHKFVLDGNPAKYLSRKGDSARAYFAPNVTAEDLENPKVTVIIAEGEFKTLSIAEAVAKAAGKKRYSVIGLAGVNGGWGREKDFVPLPDGGHEKRSRGNPRLIDDLQKVEWKGRQVFIVFDSDVGTAKHASAFKKSKHAGAMGAEHVLAELLRARGADCRIVEIPDPANGEKLGADDYIAEHGAYRFLGLLSNNWVAKRDPDAILHRPRPDAFTFADARELAARVMTRPVFVIDKLLPEGGIAMIAAAPKVGKSSVALNAAKAVCEGRRFLDVFPARQGRAAYIQTEIPAWALSERLKLMGQLPDGLLIHTPRRFHLNFFEEQGFKRTETGNRDRVACLVEALRQQAVSLVIFDPFSHFHNLSENSVEHMSHLFEIFRGIARAVPCGVLVVHHHRKVARSESGYQGAEDMRGSQALFAEPDSILSIYAEKRSDDTRRFKILFETRHAEQPEPLELLRYGGENAMLWQAKPWENTDNFRVHQNHGSILGALGEQGPMAFTPLQHKTGIPKSTLSRQLSDLVKAKKVLQEGNLYLVSGWRNEGSS